MAPFIEKSEMSLILKRQKCHQKTQKCPVGYLIISILLEVKALLQIQMQLPFTIQRIERVWVVALAVDLLEQLFFALL